MTSRTAAIDEFLAGAGWRAAKHAPLAGDASFRRYLRLAEGDRQAVLMDAPPPEENIRAFIHMARYLKDRGFSAPVVLAADETAGFALLEDLGDDLYLRVLDDGADAELLYGAAVDLLIALQAGALPEGVPPYDETRLLNEARLFIDWYLPALTGAEADREDRQAFDALWREAFDDLAEQPVVPVLRDYHADNLMWLADRRGIARVGMLDFQDAVIGPPAYDLVSLLEDARRDVEAPLVEAMIARFVAATGADEAAFRHAYAVLGAQRNTKIIGIFTRLWRRDGKARYLDMIPRVWRHLERDLGHPALSRLRAWLDGQVPPDRRCAPAHEDGHMFSTLAHE